MNPPRPRPARTVARILIGLTLIAGALFAWTAAVFIVSDSLPW